jgi:hypothetical protein
MKSRTGSLLTALATAMSLALLALGAFGSTSAGAAQPEISPSPTGSNPITFTGSSGAVSFGNGLQTLECASTSMTGQFTNPQEATAEIRFKECKALSGSGLEDTELLKGRLGYINKATKEVGLLLEPASGEVFAKDFWAGEYAAGGLIGEATPVNTLTKSIALKYTVSGTKQVPSKFEGEATEHYLTTPESKTQWGTAADITVGAFSQGGKGVEVEILADKAPGVVTKPASNVEPTTATLNGTVNPEGLATKYHFEYGTTTSYGSSTTEASAGEGTSAVAESAKLTGLTAGVTYHFRIVATNSVRTTHGFDESFTTGAPTLQPAKGGGAFPVAFTSSGEQIALFGGLSEVQCGSQSATGKFTSVKEGGLSIKLTGCKSVLGSKCGKEGVIETKELKSLLAYTYPSKITGEGRETGIVFSPASGEVVTEFSCEGGISMTVKGSFIGVLSPLKTRTGSFSLAIKQTKGHVNEPSEYETESGSKVGATLKCTENGGAAKACGVSETKPTIKLTGEEATIEE